MEYKTLSMDCEVSLDNPDPRYSHPEPGFAEKAVQIQRINELHAFGWQMKLALMARQIIEKRSNGEAIPNGTAYALDMLGVIG